MSESQSPAPDRFASKAEDWDSRPIPAQISEGVVAAIREAVPLHPSQTVLDFGAGTGLVCTRLAPHVGQILAVDVSRAMLSKLREKPECADAIAIYCQDILERPLGRQVELVVSAMAMHHVRDTPALLRALYEHLLPGGSVALADLDSEDGSFHPPETEGVYHRGFDRATLGAMLREAGFADPRFVTACEVRREQGSYPVFLVTAQKPR